MFHVTESYVAFYIYLPGKLALPLYLPSRLNVKPSFCPFWLFNNHFGKLAFPSVLLDLAVWKFGISLVLAGLAATDFNGG